MSAPLMDRIWARTKQDGDCLVWTGTKTCRGSDGYGRIKVAGKSKLAHRVVYELLIGPVPAGLTLDHLCRNRLCVKPAHLEPVSFRENCLRGVGVSAIHARLKHCKHGHPFSPENTAYEEGGRYRRCIICKRETNRRGYLRKLERQSDGAQS